MIAIILPTIAFIIMTSFEKHMIRSIKNELSAYSYSILAVAEIEQANLVMPEALIENQFNVSDSGLYAFISSSVNEQEHSGKYSKVEDVILWSSQSSLTLNLPGYLSENLLGNLLGNLQGKLTELATGQKYFASIKLNGIPHFIYSYAVSFTDEDNNFPLKVHIVRDKQTFSQLITDFKKRH
jgi:two-component system sensor histidine kinase PhoQ